MIRGKCPTCGKRFEGASPDDLPGFPFCSPRCRLIDLGRWIDGDYAIADKPAHDPREDDPGEAVAP